MLRDIKRHLTKRRVKIIATLVLLNNVYVFFDNVHDITSLRVIMFIGISLLGFLIFSWGFDNPEENSKS